MDLSGFKMTATAAIEGMAIPAWAQTGLALGLGIAAALGIGTLRRMTRGLQLNLYLVHQEDGTTDRSHQSITPVTAPYRRTSVWRSLRQGRWREDQSLRLGDYAGKFFELRVGYSLLRHYYVVAETNGIKLNRRKLEKGRRVFLQNGDRMATGDRSFEIRITPDQLEVRFSRELSQAA